MNPKNLILFLSIFIFLLFSVPSFGLEYFQNAGFETGNFNFWGTNGTVSVITGDSYVTSPYEGSYMALISTPGMSGGGYRDDNYIEQTIDPFNGYISFWYNFFTTDYDYDNPGFVVKINGTQVYSLNANDEDNVTERYNDDVYYTGWRQFQYDISGYTGSVELAIYAGNTVDTYKNSWVYIDDFSPNAPAPVPEPATIFLVGAGFLGGIFSFKKGKQKI